LRFLGRLQRLSPPPTPFDDWITPFAAHLQRDKGASRKTISSHCRYLLDFLQRLAVSPQAFSQLTVSQIEEALLRKFTEAGYARSTIRHYGEALRAFFRYAAVRGWCRSALAEGILLPRIYQQERLPSGPSWQIVQRLVAQAGGDRPNDIRDRALLLLLATYGLRAGEVVSLRLEDLDWEHETLVVTRHKTGRSQTYPLCHSVGEAILRYLREVRPRTSYRELFLHGRAPYCPLSSSALTALVRRRFVALGLAPPHCGAHALRHACATHLLECGLSLKEIGEHLGHEHPDSTRLYAKVDVVQLRRVADIDLGGLL
jgi:site-specific recombinase XerD